jgi:ATP-dependent DNA helicase RecG
MTATPIPRTLALTLYGDLDLTLLDEMPPGRTPAETRLLTGARGRAQAFAALARALADGRQGYVVCPLVDQAQDPADEERSAVATAERLRAELPHITIGLVHGRLPTVERDRVMAAFRAGELRLLVATTVIEVGVDVPAADVMLIEGADRFGLAQLHQLRGRIGRRETPHPPLCLLVTDAADGDVARRLRVLVESRDGFVIAEEDLRLRGPGELYGTRQAGLPRLRFADLARHLDLLRDARAAAFSLLDADPDLTRHPSTRAVLDSRLHEASLYGEEAG